LTQANFLVSKNGGAGVSSETKAALYRVLGRLYTVRGNGPLALRFLADDIYFSSLAYGPTDIKTAGGYVYMAMVFEATGQPNDAKKSETLLDTTEKIWRAHLVDMLNNPTTPDLTESETSEANKHLQHTMMARNKAGAAEKEVQVRGTIALLHAAVGQYAQAAEMLEADMAQGLGDHEGFNGHLAVVKKLAAEAAAAGAD